MRVSCKVYDPFLSHFTAYAKTLTARAEGKEFILKNIIPGEFEYNQDLQKKAASCSNVRTFVDTIKTLEIFIYPFLKEDMLGLSRKNLSEGMKKNILRCALNGLADLHDQGIVHNGRFKGLMDLILSR
jgi:serine/threonine protein kinase